MQSADQSINKQSNNNNNLIFNFNNSDQNSRKNSKNSQMQSKIVVNDLNHLIMMKTNSNISSYLNYNETKTQGKANEICKMQNLKQNINNQPKYDEQSNPSYEKLDNPDRANNTSTKV